MGKFLDNRLKYHTASRVGAQVGYSLAQALDPDGHIVRHTAVWAAPNDQFPKNTIASTDAIQATTDLAEVFAGTIAADGTPSAEGASLVKTVTSGSNKGFVIRNSNYPAIELYYQVPMTGVPSSDGKDSNGKYQAYHITENGLSSGTRIMDWVPPTAVIKDGSPVAGFSGIPEAYVSNAWTPLAKVGKWDPAAGTWEFVYMSGMLIFDPAQVPGDAAVRFTGFKYIGSYLNDVVEENGGAIAQLDKDVKAAETSAKTYADAKVGQVNEKIQLMYQNEEIDTKFEEVNKAFDGVNDAVATKANSADVYTKGEVYTQTEAKGLFVMYEELPEE